MTNCTNYVQFLVTHWVPKTNAATHLSKAKNGQITSAVGRDPSLHRLPLMKNLQTGRGRIFLSEGSLTSPSSRSSSCTRMQTGEIRTALNPSKTSCSKKMKSLESFLFQCKEKKKRGAGTFCSGLHCSALRTFHYT